MTTYIDKVREIVGALGEWVDCWQCGGEGGYHNCGEDVCCCLDPEPNIYCDICGGKGGWVGLSET